MSIVKEFFPESLSIKMKNNLKKTTHTREKRMRVANWLRAYASPPYGITHIPIAETYERR
jgi:hypothetical protein